jgi:hypothetical protein
MSALAMLEAALGGARPLYTLGSVERAVSEGRAKLWRNAGAALVTEMDDYPQAQERVLTAWLGAGEIGALMDLREQVEAWGREHYVTQFHVTGRPGWARVFAPHGYEPYAHVIRKVI